MPNREPWPSVEAPVPEQPARLEDDFGDWDCAACGNTVSACSWFRDGDTTCCDKCDHNKRENTMRESNTENHTPITEGTCQRIRGYIDQHAGICWCGFDSEDMNDGGYTLDHIVHSLVDDWQGFLATTRPTPPSQYGLQVLVNADSRSARWAFHEDYPLADSEADAWRYLKDALDSGYAPHHLRVVALHVVEPR